MESSAIIQKRISAEAINWFLQFHDRGNAPVDFQAFSEWLLRSPMHIEEYLAVSAAWQGIYVSDRPEFATEALIAAARTDSTHDNVVKLWTDDEKSARSECLDTSDRSSKRRWLGLAASLALSAGLWLGYVEWHQARDFQTAIGEQRSVTLADGSEIVLNTNSEVRVTLTRAERHIDLLRGEARFHVAKNPARPFIVETREAAVRALGTIFNVRANEASTEVTVLEGRVKLTELPPIAPILRLPSDEDKKSGDASTVQATPASVELDAGQRAAVSGQIIELDKGPTPERVSAWTQKRLVFRDQALSEVIREFNRYRVSRILIDSPQLADIRINGVFDPNDPYSLAAFLQDFESVHVTWSDDGTVHLSRGSQ
jgi:transmembrane sensor